jgi:haloalkane dehalogenase
MSHEVPQELRDDNADGATVTHRTPDERFVDLPDFPFAPHYVDVAARPGSTSTLRMHHLDERPSSGAGGPVVVLLHGEPSWSYLYRHMIPPIVAAGFRCIAPDLVGFGRSDKPVDRSAYSYAAHTEWLRTLLFDQLDLDDVVLFCQDWGGLLGLRLVGLHPDRFAAVLASNTTLPVGTDVPAAFAAWQEFSQTVADFDAGMIVQRASSRTLRDDEVDAYRAPFDTAESLAGARQFPMLVPTSADDPEALVNVKAWQGLETFSKPFVTVFGTADPVTRGGQRPMQVRIPGAAGQSHELVEGAHHFIQEDCPLRLAERVIDLAQGVGRGRVRGRAEHRRHRERFTTPEP